MARKILLVDDDREFLEALLPVLRKEGYAFITAVEGVQGSQIAHQEKPDLIVMDIILPAKDGLSIMEDLGRSVDTMLIPVIVMTGAREPENERKAMELGAVAFLQKPLEGADLVREIKKALGE